MTIHATLSTVLRVGGFSDSEKGFAAGSQKRRGVLPSSGKCFSGTWTKNAANHTTFGELFHRCSSFTSRESAATLFQIKILHTFTRNEIKFFYCQTGVGGPKRLGWLAIRDTVLVKLHVL